MHKSYMQSLNGLLIITCITKFKNTYINKANDHTLTEPGRQTLPAPVDQQQLGTKEPVRFAIPVSALITSS